MDMDEQYKQHILYFLFLTNESASSAANKFNSAHGKNSIDARTVSKWFQRFRVEKKNPRNKPCSSSSVDFVNTLKTYIDSDLSVDQIVKKLNFSSGTIFCHLKEIGKIPMLGKWVPRELSEIDCQQRVNICSSLLSRLENERFFNCIVTGDKRWILYNNIDDAQKKPHTTHKDRKPLSHSTTQVLLSVWWDIYGVVYFELLDSNETIDAEVCCEQLSRLNSALFKNRPRLVRTKKVLLQQDITKLHTAKILQKIKDFKWQLLPHPPYSPDITPSAYYLFVSLDNFLKGKTLYSKDDVKREVSRFFDSQPQAFYICGLTELPVRWQEIVDNEGKYITD